MTLLKVGLITNSANLLQKAIKRRQTLNKAYSAEMEEYM